MDLAFVLKYSMRNILEAINRSKASILKQIIELQYLYSQENQLYTCLKTNKNLFPYAAL